MLISRRAALVKGVAVVAGLYQASAAHAATPGVSYRLKPGPQCSCRACHHHAANRLFATRAAADQGRAHPGCRCTIIRSSAVDPAQWQALFGPGRRLRHRSADRRWASTKRALKQAAHPARAVRGEKPSRRAHPHR